MTTYARRPSTDGTDKRIHELVMRALTTKAARDSYRERERKIRQFAIGARSDWR